MNEEIKINLLNQLKDIIHNWTMSNQNIFGKSIEINLMYNTDINNFSIEVVSEKKENDKYLLDENKNRLFKPVESTISILNNELRKYNIPIIQGFDIQFSKDCTNELKIEGNIY